MEQSEDREQLPGTLRAFFQRLYRDPRYVLLDKVERFGRERFAFMETSTLLSPTGEVRGQAHLSQEFMRNGRPDGERPYGEDSVFDSLSRTRSGDVVELSDEDLVALRDESWQYYVRRNFCFLLEDHYQAREDAEHNLGICDLISRSGVGDAAKWSYVRWWPWIERDRAIAQAMLDLDRGEAQEAATGLYRAQRAIEQFGEKHTGQYADEEGGSEDLCTHMRQHIGILVDLLRRDSGLPVSLEEQFDHAAAEGNRAEMDRIRGEMIRRAVDVGEGLG
jgi:hypothetical protein